MHKFQYYYLKLDRADLYENTYELWAVQIGILRQVGLQERKSFVYKAHREFVFFTTYKGSDGSSRLIYD